MEHLSPSTVFGIVGGDFRQAALAKGLIEQGYSVKIFLLENLPPFLPTELHCNDIQQLQSCDVIILPLPVSKDGSGDILNAPMSGNTLSLSECLSVCRSDTLIFGGKVSSTEEQLAQLFGYTIHDYLKREEMAVLNAVPTAEGAIGLALSERASTLWESRCLITGFGRCGKTLALLLKGFGAQITVAARSEAELAFARTLGMHTVPLSMLSFVLTEQEVIFNTIPHPILKEDLLKKISPDCLIIDLASRPGGIDFDAASQLGLKTIWALSLPGKVAPVTAGNIIRDTVINMIKEM